MKEKSLKCDLHGLRAQLRKFDENGHYVAGSHWSIAKGGYDLYFQIYYDGTPILNNVLNKLRPCADCENFGRVAKIVMEEYPETSLK